MLEFLAGGQLRDDFDESVELFLGGAPGDVAFELGAFAGEVDARQGIGLGPGARFVLLAVEEVGLALQAG
ncbi:hypothetical protein, partial [Achromobacter ruhlandii]|uniref:hypothetical protein n=1 Tax=Achromobacter ruhlandii TaxID=72557 RepID=UPI0020167A0B